MTAAADTIRDALQRYASMPIGTAGLTDINVSLAALARLEAVAETAEALVTAISNVVDYDKGAWHGSQLKGAAR